MKKKSPLSSLEEVISGTVKTASELAQEVCQEIEGEIYRLAAKLDIATRADDRAKIEKAINAKIKKLEEAISELETKALVKATGAANKDAGLEVKHSNAYTREILKRVQDANGQNLAAVFTNKMSSSIIDRLRAATVAVIQEASLTGMSLREQKNALREKWEKACSGLGKAEFVDKMGKDWRARDYFTMNIRTNAMRVYNDVLAGDIVTDGGDLAQISRHGDPHCASCFPWEGRIISITGKTKGFPTYEQARNAGCFHPNCTHTLETVNEVVDGDEIALQKAFNKSHTNLAGDVDKMANVFRLDVARKMTLEGMEKADAEMAVKRERLAAALRVGTIRADAAQVVAGLTDKEVETLTNGVKVPVFTLAKKGEESGWNQGSKGGHIILPKTDDLKTPLSKMVQSVIAANEAKAKAAETETKEKEAESPTPQPEPVKVETPKEEPKEGTIPTRLDAYTMGRSLGGASGANATLVTDKDGNKYVMKRAGVRIANEALQNEARVDEFYRALGIKVPESVTFKDEKGNIVKISRFIDGGVTLKEWWEANEKTPAKQKAMAKRLAKGFAADCLLGNWDFIGLQGDNILIDKDGTPWRIDNGGAGAWRAMGAKKASEDWSTTITTGSISELWTMAHSNNNGKYFKMLGEDALGAEEICRGIVKGKWTKALAKLDPETRKVVKARIASCKELDDLEVLKSHGVSEKNVGAFLTGCRKYGKGAYNEERLQAALDLDPAKVSDPVREAKNRFTTAEDKLKTINQRRNEHPEIVAYTGSYYQVINTYLRNNPGDLSRLGCDKIAKDIETDKAKCPKPDIWLYRGVCAAKDASTIFGCDFDSLDSLVGTEFTENAFMSCTPIKGEGFPGQVEFRIYCPEGAEMEYVDSFSRHNGEREMLVQYGSRFAITGIEKSKTVYGTEQRVLELMLISQK